MTTLALRYLRSTAVALVIALAVMLTGSAIAAAQQPTPDDTAQTDSAQTTACDTAGDVVGDVLGTQLPVIGDLIGGASGTGTRSSWLRAMKVCKMPIPAPARTASIWPSEEETAKLACQSGTISGP